MELYAVWHGEELILIAPISTIATVLKLQKPAIERIRKENDGCFLFDYRGCWPFGVINTLTVRYWGEDWQAK